MENEDVGDFQILFTDPRNQVHREALDSVVIGMGYAQDHDLWVAFDAVNIDVSEETTVAAFSFGVTEGAGDHTSPEIELGVMIIFPTHGLSVIWENK